MGCLAWSAGGGLVLGLLARGLGRAGLGWGVGGWAAGWARLAAGLGSLLGGLAAWKLYSVWVRGFDQKF